MQRSLLLAGLAAALLPYNAAAQDNGRRSPDRDAPTVRVSLEAGFTPDPRTVEVTAGGWRPASNLADGCVGEIGGEPDVELDYRAGDWPLFFRTESAADTTLTVRTPDGQWLCDDDGAGDFNAEAGLESPVSGVYAVWVGVFNAPPAPALLHISELSQEDFGDEAGFAYEDFAFQDNGERPQPHLRAAHGEAQLHFGFHPDPFERAVMAGGSVNAFFVGDGCPGFVAAAPSFELDYQAGELPLILRARSGNDATLLVNTPDGQWLCDDDSAGDLNPEIRFDRPMSGVYDIWVGVFEGGTAEAVLSISEID